MTNGTLDLSYNHQDSFPKIDLKLPFKQGDFYYRKPMSPARDTAGIMSLKDKTLRFDMNDAMINNIDIQKDILKYLILWLIFHWKKHSYFLTDAHLTCCIF